ncbi:MAG: hypothetical protein ACREIT_00820 [Tepidisphaeraceae bacterium]
MRRTLAYILLVLVPLASFPALAQDAAQPQTTPTTNDLEQQRQESLKQIEKDTQGLPLVQADSMQDVLQFRMQGKDLVLYTRLPDTDGQAKLQVPGLGGFTKVNVRRPGDWDDGNDAAAAEGAPDSAVAPDIFQFLHYDFSQPESVMSITTVMVMPMNLQVVRDSESLSEIRNVSLIQTPGHIGEDPGDVVERNVVLRVKVTDNTTNRAAVDLVLTAPTVTELRRKYPRETAEYLQPILRGIQQESAVLAVKPAAAWQVLGYGWKPDDVLRQKIDQLVTELDADSFKARDAAAQALQKLGQPAALYLMHVPRKNLSAEQNSRIDTFLAPYRPLSDEEADRLRNDVDFLLDCLYSDDEPVRKTALEQLEKTLGRDIPLDVMQAPESRYPAITKLRAEIQGSTTQPVQER